MALSAAVAAGLVGATASPQLPFAAASTAAAAEPPVGSESSSVATSLFSTLGEGAAGGVSSAATGWAMSAMGLSSGPDYSAALAQINSSLQEIIGELDEIQQELAELTAAIQQLDCDTLSSTTLPARTLIDNLSVSYQSFVDTAAGTFNDGKGVIPSIPQMTTWANTVVDPENGVFAQIAAINDALLPAGSAQGIIQACLQPSVIAPPAAYSIDDRTYYDKVANLTNFWYLYQARGLLLVQEAYHFLAQQAEDQDGETGDPTHPGAVCTSATDSDAITYCTMAIEATNSAYTYLGQQLPLAGAPYSGTDTLAQQGAAGDAPTIWAASLEDFTQTTWDPDATKCAYPLTSKDPCGNATGTYDTADDPFKVTYANYTTWQPASSDRLTDLLRGWKSPQTAGAYLESQGFANTVDKVVISHTSYEFWVQSGVQAGIAVCFLGMDLKLPVQCSDTALTDNLVEPDYVCGNRPNYIPPSWVPTDIPFYQFHLYITQDCAGSYFWSPTPGWMIETKEANKGLGANWTQFLWPTVPASSLTCTRGRSQTNPGGVYTRCGTDFDAWFNEQVPRPVTCAGTVVGECSDEVDVTLTGPRSGAWTSPPLDGDVTATFDSTLRTITGTVRLPATTGNGTARITFDIKRAHQHRHARYNGTVRIRAGWHRPLTVHLHRAALQHDPDGTISGHLTYHRRGHGHRHRTSTLTWSVRDATLTPATTDKRDAAAAFAVTKDYVEHFYPLWFTHAQGTLQPHNELAGPEEVTPLYQGVVAINNDTLYASTPLDVAAEPAVLTVPATPAGYSILTIDPYGTIHEVGLPAKAAGVDTPTTVYELTPPGYSGPILAGATRIELPLDVMFLIFRIDRFDGQVNQDEQAAAFRAALKLQSLSAYQDDPSGGGTRVVPVSYYAAPFKTVADGLIRYRPLVFVRQLRTAVHSSITPPLTLQEQALSDAFDRLLASDNARIRRALRAGARAAHEAILDNYLGSRGPTNWIHFTNIGDWGDNVLDRASITEFIQYGNGISTAAYYHTFRDARGAVLTGSRRNGYVLTFPAGELPPAGRFWSVTAYTPQSIELIPNAADKYLVASYTPGLVTNADGSVSIYISRVRPAGVPAANWLPVGRRPFNLMLRVYGVQPGSSVANNTYLPPGVAVYHRRG